MTSALGAVVDDPDFFEAKAETITAVHAVVFVCARYSHLYTFGSEAEGDAFKRGAEDHGDGVMVLVLPRDREKLGGFDKNEADLALAAVEDAIDVAANGPDLGVGVDW